MSHMQEKFQLRVRRYEKQDMPFLIPVPPSSMRDGKLSYNYLLDLLHEEFADLELSEIRIRYKDLETNCLIRLTHHQLIECAKFPKHFMDIYLDEGRDNMKGRSRIGSVEMVHQQEHEWVSAQRFHHLEDSFIKLKSVVGGLIKLTMDERGALNEEMNKLIGEAFTKKEIDCLQLIPDEESGLPNFNHSVSKESFQGGSFSSSMILDEKSFMTSSGNPREPFLAQAVSTTFKRKVENRIHFSFLYSNPLVELVQKSDRVNLALVTNDPVNFTGEANELLSAFGRLEKQLNVHIECASLDQFIKMVKSKPIVLHIMCHGMYDPETDDSFLEFENSQGELLKLSTGMLRAVLKDSDLSDIKLVFLNACHSEKVGEVLFEFGLKCLVVIQSEHKIDDDYARAFSKNFYNELLEGRSISVAFQNAKDRLVADKINCPESCCCGHSHHPTCLWLKEAKEKSMAVAHSNHVPTCDCPRRHHHIHKNTCKWSEEFQMNYDAIEVPLEGNKEHKLCCCQPELTHDETMKLKLLFNEGVKEYGDEVIFDSLMPGIVKYINNNFYGNVIFQDIAVIGQNKLIYEMVTAFTRDNKRIIYLCGDSHTGKTSIAKHLANYMYERHKFADVRYLDMKTKTIHNFLAGIHGYENMYEKKDTDILVILDNMDQILRDEWTHYTEKMQERVEQSKMKFLVTCCSKELIKYSPIQAKESIKLISTLNQHSAAKLLLKLGEENLPLDYRNVYRLQDHGVFKPNSVKKLTAKTVMEIHVLLKTGIPMNKIQDRLYGESNPDQDLLAEKLLNERMNALVACRDSETGDPILYNVLALLSVFRNGLFLEDLERLQNMGFEGYPEEYGPVLFRLSTINDKSDLETLEFENEVADLYQSGKTDNKEIFEHFMKNNIVNRNDLINIKYQSINKENQISVVAHPWVSEVLNLVEKDAFFMLNQLIDSIKYLKSFLSSVIFRYRENFEYQEAMVECSAFNDSYGWQPFDRFDEDSQQDPEEARRYDYVLNGTFSNEDLIEIIKFHDTNIKGILVNNELISNSGRLEAFIKREKGLESQFIEIMEDFLIELLTVNKICGFYQNSLTFVKDIRHLYKTSFLLKKFKRIDIKVELHCADIQYHELKNDRNFITPERTERVWGQLETLQKVIDDYEGEDRLQFLCDMYICKYLTLETHKLKVRKLDKYIATAINQLEKASKDLDKVKDDNLNTWAKVHLLLLNIAVERNEILPNSFKLAQEIRSVFEEKKSMRLALEAILISAKLYKDSPSKCLEIAMEGLVLSQKYSQLDLDTEFNKLISSANEDLRLGFQHKFLFLNTRLFPPSQHEFKTDSLELKKNFFSHIYNVLLQADKKITVYFDIFTKSFFDRLFREKGGCKVLVIDNEFSSQEGMYLEGDHLQSVWMSKAEIAEVCSERGDNLNVGLIIITNTRGYPMFKFLSQTNTDYIIYFDFSQIEVSIHNLFKVFIIEECKSLFLSNFLGELVKNRPIQNSFEIAKRDTLETLSHKLMKEYFVCDIEITNYRVISTPNQFTELEHLLSEAINLKMNPKNACLECELKPGVLVNKSAKKLASCFFFKEPVITRDAEIRNIYELFSRNNFVNVYGARGVGKTHLVKSLMNEIIMRDLYPDGVFFFKLKEMSGINQKNNNIVEIMTLQLGDSFNQTMTTTYFEGKKMLLILDNYELVVTGTYRYPIYLLKELGNHAIHTIFVTEEMLDLSEGLSQLEHFEVLPFSEVETLEYSLSLAMPTNHFFNIHPDSLKKVYNNEYLKKSGGNPKLIIQHSQNFFNTSFNFQLEKKLKDTMYNNPSRTGTQLMYMDDLELNSFKSMNESQTGETVLSGGALNSSKNNLNQSKGNIPIKSKAESAKEKKRRKHKKDFR